MNSKFFTMTISLAAIIGMTQVTGACAPHLTERILANQEVKQIIQEVETDDLFNESCEVIRSKWIERESNGKSKVADQTFEIVEQYTGESLPDEVKASSSKILSEVEQEIMPNAVGIIGDMIDGMINIQ